MACNAPEHPFESWSHLVPQFECDDDGWNTANTPESTSNQGSVGQVHKVTAFEELPIGAAAGTVGVRGAVRDALRVVDQERVALHLFYTSTLVIRLVFLGAVTDQQFLHSSLYK